MKQLTIDKSDTAPLFLVIFFYRLVLGKLSLYYLSNSLSLFNCLFIASFIKSLVSAVMALSNDSCFLYFMIHYQYTQNNRYIHVWKKKNNSGNNTVVCTLVMRQILLSLSLLFFKIKEVIANWCFTATLKNKQTKKNMCYVTKKPGCEDLTMVENVLTLETQLDISVHHINTIIHLC